MNELVPFKAHFEYYHNDNINKFFDETVWKRIFEGREKITSRVLVHNHSVGFNIPYNKRETKVNLDFDNIHSTYPEEVTINNFNVNLEFKINSKPIIVLQIIDNKITFSNDKDEVYTIDTNENLKLIRSN